MALSTDKLTNNQQTVLDLLENSEIRALVDKRSEKTGRKIRDAEVSKIPFMIIVGEKEQVTKTVSVRRHGLGEIGVFSVAKFISLINEEIDKTIAEFKN